MSNTKVMDSLQKNASNSVNVAYGDMKLLVEATNASARTVALVVNEGRYSTLRHRIIRATALYVHERRQAFERQLLDDAKAFAKQQEDALNPNNIVPSAQTDN
jgi:hypothetical protein